MARGAHQPTIVQKSAGANGANGSSHSGGGSSSISGASYGVTGPRLKPRVCAEKPELGSLDPTPTAALRS
jgi:hypothetical protein